MLYHNKQGFTLVELVIVMGIFLTIILISAQAFERIAENSSQQSKSVETQIEGLVGLEVLRADLEQSGFGLPWSLPGVTYAEADAAGDTTLTASIRPSGTNPSTFNDAPGSDPRTVMSGNTTFNLDGGVGSNYLVIKSMLAAANDTSKKWTTLSYDTYGVRKRTQWGTNSRDFVANDRVIIVKNAMNSTPPTRQLLGSGSTFSGIFSLYSSPPTHQSGDTFVIYGVDPDTDLRMPFNRADYYIARPAKMPQVCASSGVGILYKSTVSQGAGGLTLGTPLLDCVADMQVVYGVDASGSGMSYTVPNYHTTSLSGYDAARIRNELKEIRVYILAQEGQKDRFYSYPSQTITVGESFGGALQGRVFNLLTLIGPEYKYYRWKVYTIVVKPKNLIQ
jgi:prepilin-type N-terminal cleavage/methylation domain-containing protein